MSEIINSNLQAIRKTTVAFANLFSDITFIKYDNNTGAEIDKIKVPIVYGNKEKYVKRIDIPQEKVQITLPRIEYGLINTHYDPSRKTNQYNKLQGCSLSANSEIFVHSPVPYIFNFEIVVYTRNIEDANQIIEYILPHFYPDYNLKINFVPEAGITKNVPISFLGESEDEDSTGVSDSSVRSVFRTLQFSARSWLFQPSRKMAKILYPQTFVNDIECPVNIPDFVLNFLGSPSYTTGKSFSSSFELLNDFNGFYLTPVPHLNTTYQQLSVDKFVSGTQSHKAYIQGVNSVISGVNTNHRGYPTVQMYKRPSLGVFYGKTLIEFWVNANFTILPQANKEWISLATFTSYADDMWSRGFLINVNSDYRIHLMHVPENGQSVTDIYQTTTINFPMNKWVKITALIDFGTSNKYNSQYIAVWQDGQLVSAARMTNRLTVEYARTQNLPCAAGLPLTATIQDFENACGLTFVNGLAQCHFGLYAPPLMDSGVMYNDDLKITEILNV